MCEAKTNKWPQIEYCQKHNDSIRHATAISILKNRESTYFLIL